MPVAASGSIVVAISPLGSLQLGTGSVLRNIIRNPSASRMLGRVLSKTTGRTHMLSMAAASTTAFSAPASLAAPTKVRAQITVRQHSEPVPQTHTIVSHRPHQEATKGEDTPEDTRRPMARLAVSRAGSHVALPLCGRRVRSSLPSPSRLACARTRRATTLSSASPACSAVLALAPEKTREACGVLFHVVWS